MSELGKRVVVAGDAALDWFLYPVPAEDQGENWRLHRSAHATVLPGGALLLGEFVRQALACCQVPADVFLPKPPGELRVIPPESVVHSNAMLDFFTVAQSGDTKTLRVKESLGYVGPSDKSPCPPAPEPNPQEADLVVLDDSGNGFRDSPESWPKALAGAESPWVVHKLSRPLESGLLKPEEPSPLWKKVTAAHRQRLITVVGAHDLRAEPGVDISRSLSWERTARDFAYQIRRSEELQSLQSCAFLVVLFGTDGAIVYRGGDDAQATLVFDPERREGGFAAHIPGTMYGLTSAFTAALVAGLLQGGISALESAVKYGLRCARVLLRAGFALEENGLSYPVKEIFAHGRSGGEFTSCAVPSHPHLRVADPGFWRILDQKTRNTRLLLAEDLVRHGRSRGLGNVPQGVFGKLRTIDRAEIESYSALRELIVEFLDNPRPPRPLCFGVFGQPGSGKSFGVKQLLKTLPRKDLQQRTFNISQFREYRDLVAAFHKIRDISLQGQIPFVFFDEFDAANDEGPLGWLKYFLAPMQDGEFKAGEDVHPIGKAIFVFAGGTRPTFQEFARGLADQSAPEAVPVGGEGVFRQAKGPDFVSRLRGFINVMGPNRQGPQDDAFVIRRAMLLRSLLMDSPKATHLLDSSGRLRIDDGVLRALLHVGRYRHGIRSMEAIFDMSRLTGKDRFDLAALPPRDQLDLHVDADEFLFLTRETRFCTLLSSAGGSGDTGRTVQQVLSGDGRLIETERDLVDRAARLVHEDYLRQRKLDGAAAASVVPFDELPEHKKQSNLDAAADIPHKLRVIGHGLRPVPEGKQPQTPDITDEEVHTLARLEHDRWCRDQRLQGVVYSQEPIPGKKTSPHLRPYAELPSDIQQYDVQAVTRLPAILRDLGFEVCRMEEADPILLDRLSRALHDRYGEQRRKEGDTYETDPSLVPFDDLPADLQASKCDSAAAIPRNLWRLGYGVRRTLPGCEPALLELNEEQFEQLARLEHTRWSWQRILQDWTYRKGSEDNENKTTPYLVPWDRLPPDIQENDIKTVRAIPSLLRDAGYEAYQISHGHACGAG
jgi:hypothetical protein